MPYICSNILTISSRSFESFLYSQAGYSPVNSTLPPYVLLTHAIWFLRFFNATPTELLRANLRQIPDSSNEIIPRLSEVSTRLSISLLILIIPLGSDCIRATALALSSFVTALTLHPSDNSVVTLKSASDDANSSLISFTASSTAALTTSALSASTIISDKHSLGMALSFLPPSTDTINIGAFSAASRRILDMRTFAFPLPLSISTPECPPVSPDIEIRSFVPVISVLFNLSLPCALHPPAQLASMIPSSSLSILRSFFPFNIDTSMPAAPSMPTSSDTVHTNSRRGCAMLSSSNIASA